MHYGGLFLTPADNLRWHYRSPQSYHRRIHDWRQPWSVAGSTRWHDCNIRWRLWNLASFGFTSPDGAATQPGEGTAVVVKAEALVTIGTATIAIEKNWIGLLIAVELMVDVGMALVLLTVVKNAIVGTIATAEKHEIAGIGAMTIEYLSTFVALCCHWSWCHWLSHHC